MEEKKTRWQELLQGWYEFWIHEPMNSGILGILEGNNKPKLEKLLGDMLCHDDTPCIVAYDKVNKKVRFYKQLALATKCLKRDY